MFSLFSLAHLASLACGAAAASLCVETRVLRGYPIEVSSEGTYIYVKVATVGLTECTVSGPPIMTVRDGRSVRIGAIDYFVRSGALTMELSFEWQVDQFPPDCELESAFLG
jgi:hypothetical protein